MIDAVQKERQGKEMTGMLTCKAAEKMVMPYIDKQLNDKDLEAFLGHVQHCDSCKEELEIYYTVAFGLHQLDFDTGNYNITESLADSLETAWLKVTTVRLRKIICYAINTLCVTGVLIVILLQLRIWLQHGF